jgi:hypothetical protein
MTRVKEQSMNPVVAPSNRMHTWTAAPAAVPTSRLEDPASRRRLADAAVQLVNVARLKTEVQAAINEAVASGKDAIEVLRQPGIRAQVLRAASASRELRISTALLTL